MSATEQTPTLTAADIAVLDELHESFRFVPEYADERTSLARLLAAHAETQARVEALEDALRLALPCLSQPLDDNDQGSHARAYRAVAAALSPQPTKAE